MSIGTVGPDYAAVWRTRDEVEHLDRLGYHTTGLTTPAGRRALLHRYLVAMDLRASRCGIDWQHVKAHAEGLLDLMENCGGQE